MTYALVSFDLQGTLSDAAFSDEFWIEQLSQLKAGKEHISVDEAKRVLGDFFRKSGKYSVPYYSTTYWMKELGITFDDIRARLKEPVLYEDTLEILKELHGRSRIIVLSSTTHDFIDLEIGEARAYCDAVYSSLEDWRIPGKPPELFGRIAKHFGIAPDKAIHVGDSFEMDVENPRKAGWDAFYFDPKLPRSQNVAQLRKLLQCPR